MAESERLRDRNERWYQDHAIRGIPLRVIADRDGFAIGTVHAAVKAVRASIPDSTRDEVIRDVLEHYAKVRNEAWKIADMVPAPVFVGKDGDPAIDPDTGEVVRDYSGRLRALETAMKAAEAERRMLGLDAAVKVENTITDQTAADRAAEEAAKRLEALEKEGTGDGQRTEP